MSVQQGTAEYDKQMKEYRRKVKKQIAEYQAFLRQLKEEDELEMEFESRKTCPHF